MILRLYYQPTVYPLLFTHQTAHHAGRIRSLMTMVCGDEEMINFDF